jgi:TonB family protein
MWYPPSPPGRRPKACSTRLPPPTSQLDVRQPHNGAGPALRRRARHAVARLAVLAALLGVVAADAAAQCVRVGGAVPAPTKILHVDPVYPPAAIAARVQGIVIIEATVETSGAVSSTLVLRSIWLLDGAAVAAVSQWRYAPLAAGSPCVLLTVTVNFTLPTETDAPSNLQAAVAGHLLTLSWQPPTVAVTAYLIEAGTAPGLSNIASQPVPASPPGLSVTVPNGTYFIRVRAVRPAGNSAPSNEVAAVVGCSQPPAAPEAFVMTQGPGGNPVQFTWASPVVPVDGLPARLLGAHVRRRTQHGAGFGPCCCCQ